MIAHARTIVSHRNGCFPPKADIVPMPASNLKRTLTGASKCKRKEVYDALSTLAGQGPDVDPETYPRARRRSVCTLGSDTVPTAKAL